MGRLVHVHGWRLRTAAFGVAVLELAAERGRGKIDIAEVMRLAREESTDPAARRLARRAKAIRVAYERAKRETADNGAMPGALYGAGPWSDGEERPGAPCRCGESWLLCTDCKSFIAQDRLHECRGPRVLVPLDHDHRHCDVCRLPAPEPIAVAGFRRGSDGAVHREGWWVPNGVELIPIQLHWIVGPVALSSRVSLKRYVLGWACHAHREQVEERGALPQSHEIVLEPGERRKPQHARGVVPFAEQGERETAEAIDAFSDAEEEIERRLDQHFLSRRGRRPRGS